MNGETIVGVGSPNHCKSPAYRLELDDNGNAIHAPCPGAEALPDGFQPIELPLAEERDAAAVWLAQVAPPDTRAA